MFDMNMLFYPTGSHPVNSRIVGGRFLAHCCLTRIERAFLAADLHTGAAQLVTPTIVQSAMLARVNRTYAGWAVKQMPLRTDIISGSLPLVPQRSPAVPQSESNGHTLPAIVSAEIDDDTVIAFVRAVGIKRTLDAAVAVEAAQ
jgi:hypothetical protein